LIKELEQKPDSFDFAERKQALSALFEKVQGDEITLPKADAEQICLSRKSSVVSGIDGSFGAQREPSRHYKHLCRHTCCGYRRD